ncbi:MAG: MFS transporter [Proteobacteria bacterium]|nr:MFS transporter [Pseudomonadota bacterium]
MSPTAGGRVFYGWYVTAVALLANFMSIGTSFYIFNAFMEPLCQARNWTRTDISLALMAGFIAAYLTQPVFGTLVMRLGPRILMTLGALAAGFSFFLLGRVETLWQFYLVFVLLNVANSSYGGVVANTAVNNWFVRRRGRAMGLAAVGISLSGAIMPFLAMLMILRMSMAAAFLWIGVLMAVLGPLAWLVVRDWPEGMGLSPDGDAAGAAGNETHGEAMSDPVPGSPWTLGRLMKTGAFWKTGLFFGLCLAGPTGVMSQLKPRFADVGFDDVTAMALMSVTALMGAVGKYAWGAFCDWFEPRRVVMVMAGVNALGLSFALFGGSPAALVLFILVFGFAMGGIMATCPVLVADLFGRESFASVFRYLPIFMLIELAGLPIAGMSFDLLGSYDTAYAAFIVFNLAAAGLMATVRRPGPAADA